jgi:hypothetical protein
MSTLKQVDQAAGKRLLNTLAIQTAQSESLHTQWQMQEKFIAALMLLSKSPAQVFELIEASDLPPNVFLLHLMLIADHQGELISRLGDNFKVAFPYDAATKKYFFRFVFAGKRKRYIFKALPLNIRSGASINIDTLMRLNEHAFDDMAKDLMMILLYAGGKFAFANTRAPLERFNIGKLIGKTREIERYVRQRYTQILMMSHMRLH